MELISIYFRTSVIFTVQSLTAGRKAQSLSSVPKRVAFLFTGPQEE